MRKQYEVQDIEKIMDKARKKNEIRKTGGLVVRMVKYLATEKGTLEPTL